MYMGWVELQQLNAKCTSLKPYIILPEHFPSKYRVGEQIENKWAKQKTFNFSLRKIEDFENFKIFQGWESA